VPNPTNVKAGLSFWHALLKHKNTVCADLSLRPVILLAAVSIDSLPGAPDTGIAGQREHHFEKQNLPTCARSVDTCTRKSSRIKIGELPDVGSCGQFYCLRRSVGERHGLPTGEGRCTGTGKTTAAEATAGRNHLGK
jgi:hypothetical protein